MGSFALANCAEHSGWVLLSQSSALDFVFPVLIISGVITLGRLAGSFEAEGTDHEVLSDASDRVIGAPHDSAIRQLF